MKQTRQAVIYARVSSKEQQKEGFSIDAQLKLLRGYANNLALVVPPEYEFVDIETAKRTGRHHFARMVKFLRHQQTKPRDRACRILLVEKTDRLYRNIKDWVTLDELDLEIHLVKENVILSHDSRSSEKFMHGIRVLMAKNYIDNLSEEVRKGMTEKAEQGIYPSVAPIGYLNVECEKKHVIHPDPVLGPLVRRVFQWYATGNYSLLQLARKAHEEGLVSRKSGNKIYKGSLHKMLKNPMYYGVFVWKGKQYRGTHEPLISQQLFDRVQAVMSKNGNHRTRQHKHRWTFQGMLTCGHCGCTLTAEIKKQRYIYYHCTGYHGNCPEKKYVREEEVDQQFQKALAAIQLDEDVLQWVVSALKASHADEKAYHDTQITKLQQRYSTLQNRLDTMYIDKLDGNITQEFYDQKSQEWRTEQEHILENIELHQKANRSYLDKGILLLELTQQAVRLYKQQTAAEKRRLLHCVFSNSLWKDGRLYPHYRQPFEILAVTNRAYQRQKAVSPAENSLRLVWRSTVDAYRTFFVGLSREIAAEYFEYSASSQLFREAS